MSPARDPRRERPYGGGSNVPTPATGPRDPRHRIHDQAEGSGVHDDPDVFGPDRFGRRSLRLDPRGPLRAERGGLTVEVDRYLGKLPGGALTLDLAKLLSEVFRVRPDARVEIKLGGGLELAPSGALRVKAAVGVVDLVNATGGTADGTVAGVSSASLAAMKVDVDNNNADILAQLAAIKATLKTAGFGVGV